MTVTARTILPIILTIAYAIGLLSIPQWTAKLDFAVSDNSYITKQFSYQFFLLVITAISVLTTNLLNRHNFKTYFSFGQISAAGQELKFFGIKQGDTWTKTGLSLCVVISFVTAVFLYFQLRQADPDWASLQSGIFWIILFSVTNAFGEEMIFRLGIVSPLSGRLAPKSIFLISAVLFGIPHFAGMPNGIIGVTLAGILGFVSKINVRNQRLLLGMDNSFPTGRFNNRNVVPDERKCQPLITSPLCRQLCQTCQIL